MQEEVKHYKVKSLPTKLRPSSVYYVKETSQNTVKTYITDQNGIPYPLIDLEGGGGTGNIISVTGTGVTGTTSDPVINISTFKSSNSGNLIELSTNDGKLFVKPITSPDGSIDIVSTATSLEIQLGASLQTQIQNALQSGDNISELENDAGYITLEDIPFSSVAATAWTTGHTTATGNPYLAGTLVYYQGHIFQANFNNDSITPEIGGNVYWTDLGVGYLIDQEQTDWLAVSGSAFIKNKPTNVSSFTNDAGYIDSSALSPYLLSTTAASTYFPKPTGTISEYVRGDGTLATFPTIPAGGLPPGGTAGQILTKVDATDYNAIWQENYADWTSVVKHIVKNDGTALITKGTPVYVTGANGTNILVRAASNTSEATSSKTMGLMQSNITTSGGTQTGFVITEGLLGGLNTAGQTAGAPVWLGANGALVYGLTNKPYAPAHLVFIGIVTKVSAGSGEIFVKIQNGFELEELHNVSISNETHGDLIQYNSSTGLWENKKSYFSFKLSERGQEVSNTTTETEICRVLLPENTFSNVDVLNVASLMVSKEGTDTKYTIYIRLSQSNIFSSGHTSIAAYSVNGTTQLTNIERTFFIIGDSIKGLSKSDTTKVTDKNDSTYPIEQRFFDRSKNYYLYISVQTDSPSSDRIRFEGININNI